MIPMVSHEQYLSDRRSYELAQAEEVALFAARRAVFGGAIGETLVRALQQLCQSKRQVVRDHAIRLAHIASSIAHNARTGDAA